MQAIPPEAYSTGLAFNPPDQQTLYHRSGCFQELAIAERDPALCDAVRERTSWFFDGSGISQARCLARVLERQEADTAALARVDPGQIHRLVGVDVRRNGNGRESTW